MKNKKGFSLIEVMTVVIILGILASLSIPWVIGYVRDARNDRAKSVLIMIAQGFKNFRNDFSQYTVNSIGPIFRQNLQQHVNLNSCNEALVAVENNTVNYDFLIRCSYLPNIDYAALKYNFYLSGAACSSCGGTANDLACMIGADTGDYCPSYCAYIDRDNNLHEVRGCN
jgi:prepilin-type N-terminal cleavage/methylation domain